MHRFGRVGYCMADHPGLPIMACEDGQRRMHVGFRDYGAKADPHVEYLEHLGPADGAMPLDQLEDRRRRRQIVEHEADLDLHPRQVQEAVPGDVDQRLDRRYALDQFQDLRHVDEGRPEQLLADAVPQLGDDLLGQEPAHLKQRFARQSKAVAMDAIAGDADDAVPGLQVAADDDAVERHGADGGTDQVEAAHHLGPLRDLAAGNGDPGLSRAFRQPDRNPVEHRRLGALDGDVIDHRYRARTDAEQVVDVHGDAIDADRIVFFHHLRDEGFRPDSIRAEGEADTADVDHIGEIADRQLHRAEAGFRPVRGNALDNPPQPSIGLRDIDPGRFVAFGNGVGSGHARLPKLSRLQLDG